jgi:hypothetical protein
MSIVVHFGRDKYEAPSSPMTGAELRRLFNVPGTDDLFRARGSKIDPDHPNAIADGEQVELKNGDHFVAIPRDITGGAVELSTLPSRIRDELSLVAEELAAGPIAVVDLGGERAVIVPLEAAGWQPSRLDVLIKLPALYPDQRPDLIFLPVTATSPWGAPTRIMAAVSLAGRQWNQISWHMTGAYDTARNNLFDFVKSIFRYLSRPNP